MANALPQGENFDRLPQGAEDLGISRAMTADEAAHYGEAKTEKKLEIHLAPDTLGHVGNFPITNTFVTSIIVGVFLVVVAVLLGRKVKDGVPGPIQNFVETIFEGILGFIEETLEDRKLALKLFPFLATLFFFIWMSNWIEFLPGVGSIEYDHKHLFRGVNTDLNVTIALAIISFFTIEAMGIRTLGFFTYMNRFFNFSGHNIGERILNFFIGIIELVSELARLIAFSFRLFGNIFAGAVLIAVTMFFVPQIVPVPLMMFELFVGFIQAAVFPLLTLFFIKIAITKPEH